MTAVTQFIAIARLTCTAILHQPIVLLLTLTSILSIYAVPVALVHQFGEHGRLVRDSALSIHFVFGAIIAIYGGCYAIRNDLENGTASAILSKPVSRLNYLLAKSTGVSLVLLLYTGLLLVTSWMALNVSPSPFVIDWSLALSALLLPLVALIVAGAIHFRFRRPFAITSLIWTALLTAALPFVTRALQSPDGQFQLFIDWRILPTIILGALCLCILGAASLTCATRLRAPQTLAICCLLFVCGLLSDYFLAPHIQSNLLAGLFYRITPNWLHFWMADALADGGIIPWSYVMQSAAYCVVYCVGLLLIARSLFTHTEVPAI